MRKKIVQRYDIYNDDTIIEYKVYDFILFTISKKVKNWGNIIEF